MPGWKQDLIETFDYAFKRLRTRVEGLTDEEYLWEPAPGCWTIRPDASGNHRGDWEAPMWGAPLTTIAWRLGHLVQNLFDPRYATHLGLQPLAPPPPSLRATAAGALRLLDEGYAVTRGYLEAVPEARLGEPLGAVAGPWAESDRAAFILHMLDELIHHAAEVGVLRDLHRAMQGPNPLVDAVLDGDRPRTTELRTSRPDLLRRALAERADLAVQAAGQRRWSALPLVIELGFPLALHDGTSVLHHAAAAGNRAAIEELLAAGADPTVRDPLYRATPREWADHFGHADAAAALDGP